MDKIDQNKARELLERPFTPEALRQNQAKGLTYIPVSEVIARLNAVLGFDWDWTVLGYSIPEDHPDWVVCHGRLSIHLNHPYGTRIVSRDGFGGQQIKRKRGGDVNDLGDEFKGASSDALKKAAQAFGIGLDLARTEEAIHAEWNASRPDPDPELLRAVRDRLETLTESQKSTAKRYWKENFGGKIERALDDELKALLGTLEKIANTPEEAQPEPASASDAEAEHDHVLTTVRGLLGAMDEDKLVAARAHWKSVSGGSLEAASIEQLDAFKGYLNLVNLGGTEDGD